MEGHKASWILEILRRQAMEGSPPRDSPFRLPIFHLLDPRLQKTLLLRCLSSDLSAGNLAGETLQILELLEEVDRALGVAQTSESLKAAYSAVAAELTAAPLRSGSGADFFEAVNSIWNCRVGDLERSEARGMMGDALREWRRRMEEAVVSDAAREGVLRRDTRGEAMEALRKYLRVARTEMGPSLLECSARGVGGKPDVGDREGIDVGAGEREGARDLGLPTEQNDAFGAVSMELSQLDRPEAIIGAKETLLAPETERRKRNALSGQTDVPGQGRTFKELDFLPMQEVNKVKEALKSSFAELLKAVVDPLPNALTRAAEVQSSMAEKSANPFNTKKGQNQMSMGEPGPSIQMHAQATVTESAAVQGSSFLCPTKLRPSLMDRNPTARTYEWDEDSIEVSSDDSPNSSKRLQSLAPKDQRGSPLHLQEFKKIVRRRKARRWTPQEEDALREAVKKLGKGNWKLILECYPGAFEGRTVVDLKDKWRNMTR